MPSSLDDYLTQLEQCDELPVPLSVEREDLKKPVQAYLWRQETREGSAWQSSKIHLCIYTHGAGGTCLSSASLNLCEGLVSASSSETALVVLAFDGPMHLGSRTKSFASLIRWASCSTKVHEISAAGRSMGCRAAALAIAECLDLPKLSRKLVLQSYPLLGAGKGTKDIERKQVLSDLPEDAQILFQIGAQDDMCPLDELRDLQNSSIKSKCSTITIQGADHGLQLVGGTAPRGQKENATKTIGRKAGCLAGDWLLSPPNGNKEGVLELQTEAAADEEVITAHWSGFSPWSGDKSGKVKSKKRSVSPQQKGAHQLDPSPRQSKRIRA